jgi:cystathionine gamma-synthase
MQACSPGTAQLFSHLDARGALSVSYEDVSDLEALTDAVRPTTAALWVETPSNPQLRIADLEALSQFADAHDLLLIVDNTVLSPILQRPIEYGADLVVYSSIHRLDGHGDVTGGAVVAKTEALAQTLETAAVRHSLQASPDDCRLILRGTKTLSVRVQQQENNARSVAYALDEHPAVERVFYPGLRTHSEHTTARRQQDGYGGLLSIEVDESVDVHTVLQATDVFSVDETRGGVESTIAHPASMSQGSFSQKQREAGGISERLVRLSVGIESTDDLLQDLEQALAAAQTDSTPVPGRKSQEPVPVQAEV